jgi:hypothetical protein
MRGLTGQATVGGFVRSALMLMACTAAIALLFVPFAMRHSGSAGLMGLAAAAAICLVCGWMSEGVAHLVGRFGSPLVAMLMGMAIRMVPPLAICLALAIQGIHGRQHVAFIGYLLTFYLATLAVETWLAVKRAALRRAI